MNSELEWQRRYEENDTPWDKGVAAPALIKFLHEKQISGRVLVPGCGRGHEVRAIGLLPQTTVVGLDLSATAVSEAKKLSEETTKEQEVVFVEGDFLNLPSQFERSFSWLVEHTCFCALEPSQRPAYVQAAALALQKGGRIFGIFYINPDTESGPPFEVSREELSKLFDPYFVLVKEWVPAESFPGRENREVVRIMQKR